jgi:hypothetical protein
MHYSPLWQAPHLLVHRATQTAAGLFRYATLTGGSEISIESDTMAIYRDLEAMTFEASDAR